MKRTKWFRFRSNAIFEPFTIQGPEWLRDWVVMLVFVAAAAFIVFGIPLLR
jgi:hypothetical protein